MVPQPDQDRSPFGTWKEWARHIISEVERLTELTAATLQRMDNNREEADRKLAEVKETVLDRLAQSVRLNNDEFTALKVEIAVLKTKAALWGALGASIPALIGIVVNIYLRLHHP